jgi:DNA primase
MVNNSIDIVDYARDLGVELRPSGMRLVGRCAIPRHDDRTPSFNVWPESGSWWCFGACARGGGGDVIDLCQAVEGGESWEAMMTLAICYNVELPERPQGWHDWQDEKGRRRKMLRDRRAQHYQRRFLKFFREDLEIIEDSEEREQEARRIYDDLASLARRCAFYAEERSS